MDTDKLLKSIEENQQCILTQQQTLMRMHDTVDIKFNKILKQLEKFRKEWRVKKSIQNCIISQDLLSVGQNDMIFAINKLVDEFNTERRETDNRIKHLSTEMQILTQLFVHGDDIKTYDLSTTFPEAYTRIIDLEKQRAKTKEFYHHQTDSSGSEDSSENGIPLTDLSKKEL